MRAAREYSDGVTFDVAVIGAGPAGVAASVELARAGRDVVLLDKATFPRDKICGDGITTSALRHLEWLGLDPGVVASWCDVQDVVLRSPSAVEVTLPLPRGQGRFAAVARRNDLDAALVDLAKKSGVAVPEGTSVDGVDPGVDGVTLTTPKGSIRATYVIAADGMWSPTRKAIGLEVPGYRGEWHAFRQYFTNVTGPASEKLMVSFEADIIPGYFWAFPLPDGGANVGFGIDRGGKHTTQDMKRLWPDLLARPHLAAWLGPDAVPESPHRAWPIPARVDTMPSGTGRVLLAGDAVGACDPMTGEGIGQALSTGRMAAAAVNRCWSDPTAVQREYRAALDGEMVPDHRVSLLLMRALGHRKGVRFAIWLAGVSSWTRQNFARWLFEDYPRAIAMTPRRWRRGALSGPGAFVTRAARPDGDATS